MGPYLILALCLDETYFLLTMGLIRPYFIRLALGPEATVLLIDNIVCCLNIAISFAVNV